MRTRSAVVFVALALVVAALGCRRSSTTATGAVRHAVTVDSEGFHPDKIQATAGQPVTLALTRTTDKTCATEVVVPDYNKKKELPLNQTVELTFTPKKAGDIKFSCGMEMFTGVVEVR